MLRIHSNKEGLMAHETATHLSPELQRCIDECLHCYATCEATTAHCLEQGGKHVESVHMRLLADCAAICRTSAGFMLRGSNLHHRVCALCAEICRSCAESCDRVDPNDQMMKDCAAQCRSCADSCDRMAGNA
jgi:hypothetical protein